MENAVEKLPCTKCGEQKSLDAFYKNTRYSRGYMTVCKACLQKNSIRWNKIHKTKIHTARVPVPCAEISTIDLAWIAGFIDAEGSFGVAASTNNRAYPRINVYNGDDRPLRYIAQKIGGAVSTAVRKNPQFKLTQSENRLFIHSKAGVENAYRKLLPYMVIKKAHLEAVKKACDCSKEVSFDLKQTLHALNKVSDIMIAGSVSKKVEFFDQTPEQWAYFAGYLEGDGTFVLQPQYFGKTKYLYPWICVYSTRIEGLRYMHDLFGGLIKTRKRKADWNVECCLSFQDSGYVKEIISRLGPYIKFRREELEIMLRACSVGSKERQSMQDELKKIHGSFKEVDADA